MKFDEIKTCVEPDKKSLSVFMPFYNEESVIEEMVENSISYLEDLENDYEFLIVDDGSTDSTPEKADQLEERYPGVRAVHHSVNQGYGRALATGFQESSGELVFYTDGDGQFDIEELDRFLDEINGYDLVVGFRENRDDAVSRKIISSVFNSLAKLMLPIQVQDIDCGFKLVRSEVVSDIDLDTKRTVDAELLAKAGDRGYRIKELPVTHFEREDGESEAEGIIGVRIGLIVKSIQELLQIRRMIN